VQADLKILPFWQYLHGSRDLKYDAFLQACTF
jgi:hypothetical protein